jgi:hypothetical protein
MRDVEEIFEAVGGEFLYDARFADSAVSQEYDFVGSFA